MRDTTLFSMMLGLKDWDVAEVLPDLAKRTLTLRLKSSRHEEPACPDCGRPLVVLSRDEAHLRCSWNVMQFRTTLVFPTPRLACRVHDPVETAPAPELARLRDVSVG